MYFVKAYSKLNLFLDILKKREDGFHDILTVYQSINLYDELSFKESERLMLRISDKTIPLDNSNTVVKSFNIFTSYLEKKNIKKQCFEIRIVKNTPSGSGMGGGSADGAATLRFLNRYHGNLFSNEEIGKMAFRVGADVMFLLRGGLAIGEGLGEKLEYFNYPEFEKYNIAIIYPNIYISTKWAYENYDKYLTNDKKCYNINNLKIGFNEFISSLKYSYNIFENLIYNHYPRLQEIKKKLDGMSPIFSMMTGSGSAIFAIFDDKGSLNGMKKEFGGNNVIFTTPITQRKINNEFLTKL